MRLPVRFGGAVWCWLLNKSADALLNSTQTSLRRSIDAWLHDRPIQLPSPILSISGTPPSRGAGAGGMGSSGGRGQARRMPRSGRCRRWVSGWVRGWVIWG